MIYTLDEFRWISRRSKWFLRWRLSFKVPGIFFADNDKRFAYSHMFFFFQRTVFGILKTKMGKKNQESNLMQIEFIPFKSIDFIMSDNMLKKGMSVGF